MPENDAKNGARATRRLRISCSTPHGVHGTLAFSIYMLYVGRPNILLAHAESERCTLSADPLLYRSMACDLNAKTKHVLLLNALHILWPTHSLPSRLNSLYRPWSKWKHWAITYRSMLYSGSTTTLCTCAIAILLSSNWNEPLHRPQYYKDCFADLGDQGKIASVTVLPDVGHSVSL